MSLDLAPAGRTRYFSRDFYETRRRLALAFSRLNRNEVPNRLRQTMLEAHLRLDQSDPDAILRRWNRRGEGPSAKAHLLRAFAVAAKELAELAEILAGVVAGEDPTVRWRGAFRCAYRSEADGSVQPYYVYVPYSYRPNRRHPLLVALHGAGEGEEGIFDRGELEDWAEQNGWLIACPRGRGRCFYLDEAENDVLRVITEVSRRYKVDLSRICLTGCSMGGYGTLNIGLRFPDVFAAIAPVCPISDNEIWPKLLASDEMMELGARSIAPIRLARNAVNLPIHLFHGTEDKVVSVEHSRRIAQELKNAGLDARCCEYEGVRHDAWERAWRDPEFFGFVSQAARVDTVRRIVYRTCSARYGRAYWLENVVPSNPPHFGGIEALALADKVLVKTDGVLAFSVNVARSPLRGRKRIRVEVDGEDFDLGITRGRTVDFAYTDGEWTARRRLPASFKTGRVCGPLADVFAYPFAIVPGRRGTARKRKWCDEQAEFLKRAWDEKTGGNARIVREDRITAGEIENSGIVLVGNAMRGDLKNAPLAPVVLSEQAAEIAGLTVLAPNPGVEIVGPNPANPRRYLLRIDIYRPEGIVPVPFFRIPPFGDWLIFRGGEKGVLPGTVRTGWFGAEWPKPL